MKKLPVEVGLWKFYVDNYPLGIALRRSPQDEGPGVYAKPRVMFRPMQKIDCDRKVTAPNGVNFFRVQATTGWVFDKRIGENGNESLMMLPSTKITKGLFAYEVLGRPKDKSLAVRNRTLVHDECKTSRELMKGEVVVADVIR